MQSYIKGFVANGGAIATLTTSFQDIPNMTFTLVPGATYRFEAYFNYQVTAGTSPTVAPAMGGTVTASFLDYRTSIATNNGGGSSSFVENVLSNSNRQGSSVVSTVSANLPVLMSGMIVASAAGTLTAQMRLFGGTSPAGNVQSGGRFLLEQIA